jgi:hypothetical protein
MIRRELSQESQADAHTGTATLGRKPVASEPFARQGIVRGFQLGSMWRFRASDIDRWIVEQLAS